VALLFFFLCTGSSCSAATSVERFEVLSSPSPQVFKEPPRSNVGLWQFEPLGGVWSHTRPASDSFFLRNGGRFITAIPVPSALPTAMRTNPVHRSLFNGMLMLNPRTWRFIRNLSEGPRVPMKITFPIRIGSSCLVGSPLRPPGNVLSVVPFV